MASDVDADDQPWVAIEWDDRKTVAGVFQDAGGVLPAEGLVAVYDGLIAVAQWGYQVALDREFSWCRGNGPGARTAHENPYRADRV